MTKLQNRNLKITSNTNTKVLDLTKKAITFIDLFFIYLFFSELKKSLETKYVDLQDKKISSTFVFVFLFLFFFVVLVFVFFFLFFFFFFFFFISG